MSEDSSDQVLSREEVDSLLSGFDETEGETQASVPAKEPAPKSPAGTSAQVELYDLGYQDRIVREKMPALEVVTKHFVRDFRVALHALTGKPPELELVSGGVVVQKFDQFMSKPAMPASLNVVQVKPLRGKGLIIIEPDLIGTIVDRLFGGNGVLPVQMEGREYSETESRIIVKLVSAFSACYANAWSSIYPIQLEYLRSETQTQFAGVAAADEMVIATQFDIEIMGLTAAIHFCIPYVAFEPIRETLHEDINTDEAGHDDSWLKKLGAQLESADIELVAELATAKLSFGQVINLEVGDFVEVDLKEQIVASVHSVPFLKCRYGTDGRNFAIRVTEVVTGPNELVSGIANG